MDELSGLDASLLYSETAATPTHTLKILVVQIPSNGVASAHARLREFVRERLPAFPLFHLRLASAPLSIGHPFWHLQELADLDAHMEHCVLQPGETLAQRLAAFVTPRLPRDRPLWRLLVVEGLPQDRVALAFKIHHALADGIAAAHILTALVGRDDAAPEVAAPEVAAPEVAAPEVAAPEVAAPEVAAPEVADPEVADPAPHDTAPAADAGARLQLLAEGLSERTRELAAMGPLLLQTGVALVRRARRRRRLNVPEARIFRGPSTSFNAKLGVGRRLALTRFSLADIRSVKHSGGASVNHVLLAVVGGGLRRYFIGRGEAVRGPLVAAVPIGFLAETDRTAGNRVSNMMVPVHTEIADEHARLTATRASSIAAKELHDVFGPDLLLRWARQVRRRPLRTLWRVVGVYAPRPPINLIVSNVPGPRHALASDGLRVTELYSVGLLVERVGLNLTCWSYDGHLYVSILACAEHGTGVDAIADGMHAAFATLLDDVAPHEPRP